MSRFVTSIVKTFNSLIDYKDNKIIVIFDNNNKIWFSISDIFKTLGYSSPNKEIKRSDINIENIKTYQEIYDSLPKKYINFEKPKNLQPHMKMTNETGIYLILTKSKKKIAKEFRDSLYQDILPTLRERGEYKFSLTDRKKLNNVSKTIKNLKKELNRTKKQSFNNKTGKGFIYVLKVKTQHNGQEKDCYKIGYTANLEKRMATYKTGNPDIKLEHHENINCNKKQLEKCIISLNILKLLKNKTEIICDVPLEKIKDEIDECKKLIHKFNN
jgi:prophage antirepressor-like protein